MVITFSYLSHYKKTLITACILTIIMITWQVIFTGEIRSHVPVTPYHLFPSEVSFVSSCNITRFPEHVMRKESMQKVALTNWTFVYSAYYDTAKPSAVKVIGICQASKLTYNCHLWYKRINEGEIVMTTTNASVFYSQFHKKTVAISCYFLCPVVETRPAFAVSIVVRTQCSPANNMIEIAYIRKNEYTRNFTMCLCPFHDNINAADRLLEWFEFNRILGADNFLLYNFTGGQNLHEVINYYVKIGLAEIFQWPLPMVYGNLLHNKLLDDYAQVSAYNDCLLRSKSTSKYVVITDFDEFIVPHVKGSRTWMDMFRRLPKADAYTFRHCFFQSKNIQNEFQYPEKETARKYNITSLIALKRYGDIFPHGPRSKYITRTNASYDLRTHLQLGAKAYPVEIDIAFLHHYKKGKHLKGNRKPMVMEKTVLNKYGHELSNKVANVWSKIRKQQKIINV